jgi:CRP-like cAMP-binding protein
MTAISGDALEGAIRKIGRLARLDDEDFRMFEALPFRVASLPAGRYLVREGVAADECGLLVQGFACRHKTTASGGRQIVSFHMRGDILDIQLLLLAVPDHNVQAVTEVRVAWVPKAQLRQLIRQRPSIADALWRDTLIDASIFREWVLNVGRRDARSRIAHLLCEFAARCEVAGLGSADRFELPMTQEMIADATGLTGVHVNRMLRQLADEGLITRSGRQVRIIDPERLREVADFDPAYLHAA